MRKSKGKGGKTQWTGLFYKIEYIVLLYAVVTATINWLNIAGITSFTAWFMEPTFMAVSLIVTLLVHYELGVINKKSIFLEKAYIYVRGILIANIVSVGTLPQLLLLLFVIGYMVWNSREEKHNLKEIVYLVLVSVVGMEIYSIALFLNKKYESVAGDFLKTFWLDIIFILLLVAYFLIERDKGIITENLRKKIRYMGSTLCILALGTFLFFQITVLVARDKVDNNQEGLYLLKHCEDPSLVVTLTENKRTGKATLSFTKYTGEKNQKVRLEKYDDSTYKIFLNDSQYAMGAWKSETAGKTFVTLKEPAVAKGQQWRVELGSAEQGGYTFYSRYDEPLSYQKLETTGSLKISVENNPKGNEYFIVERATADEFLTKMLLECENIFTPSSLMETILGYMGAWSIILYILIGVIYAGLLYARRWLVDKTMLLCVVMFTYMLVYSALSVVALFAVAVGVLCLDVTKQKR